MKNIFDLYKDTMIKEGEKIKLDAGNSIIEITLRISRKAKRISLRIDHLNNAELVIPKNTSMKTANNFLKMHHTWLIAKFAGRKTFEKSDYDAGTSIPVLGNSLTIAHTGKLRGITYISDDRIMVSGPKENTHKKVKTFLFKIAKDKASGFAYAISETSGLQFKKITIKDTKTRWGSCSRDKNIALSYRLVHAPQEVFEYVIAHEMAHLKHMNHSISFWNTVKELHPEYKKHRLWLRENSQKLHQYC